MQKLLQYDWPGNVRELEHVTERAVATCERKLIGYDDIVLPGSAEDVHFLPFHVAKEQIIESFERTYIEKLLLSCNGNISEAARFAQKHRRAFWELIRKHGIEVNRFKSDHYAPTMAS
jgi:DNA-binding NtrC family response regulator